MKQRKGPGVVFSAVKEALHDICGYSDSFEDVLKWVRKRPHFEVYIYFDPGDIGKPPSVHPDVVKLWGDLNDTVEEDPDDNEVALGVDDVCLLLKQFPEKILPKRLQPRRNDEDKDAETVKMLAKYPVHVLQAALELAKKRGNR